MRSNRRWAALGAGLLLTTTLAACGGDGADVEQDPTEALSDAIEALGDYDGIEMGLSLVGDRDAILAAAGDDLDERAADLLLTSSIVIRAAGEDEDDAQAEFVVNLGDQQAVEMRVLPEQQVFLRVDLDAIGTAVDDPSFASGVDEALGMADAFGLGEVATAVRGGDWIELTGAEQLAELAGGATGATEEPSEEEVEDVRDRMVAALQRFLDEDVALTYVGEEEAGERITAATTEGELAGLFDEIATIAGDLSGVDPAALGEEMPDQTSDTPVEIDFWIDGGELRQVGYDLSQIEGEDGAPEGTFVAVTIEEFGGGVEAPAESTEIDLFALIGNMFGGGFGEGDLGGFDDAGMDDAGMDDAGMDDAGMDDAGMEGDPLGGQCIEEDQLEELTGGDETARAELDAAIEMGLIEVC